jgi:hypothetical protein
MRDRETIDSELRRIALSRRSIREQGGRLSSQRVDELLDERLGHTPGTRADDAGYARVVAGTPNKTKSITTPRPKRALRRVGLLAALPLSLVAVAAVFVALFAAHRPHPTAEPPAVTPPSAARPAPAAPKPQAPVVDIVDRAFIAALKQNGVPVPSHDYATTHGHAVCDFLTRQPNFAEAVRFVQGSSIWDANQSADFTAGAIVSYCPQYETASAAETQQGFQRALSDLQAIEGKLKGIEGDLQGIEGGLPNLPGHP